MKKHENLIYVTGDTHGDLTRFKKAKHLKKGDFLIICGDFGFIWDGSKKEKSLLKRLGKKKYHILFVDGIHENFSELDSYPEEEWNGGLSRRISGNLRYLKRGEIFTLGKKTALAFGGGHVETTEFAGETETETIEFFGDGDGEAVYDVPESFGKGKEETSPGIPKEAEYRNGLRALARHNGAVDYIISHEAPSKIAEFLELPNSDKSRANAYLDILGESCSFERWFFGHHHINKIVTSKYFALFDRIIRADEVIKANK